MLMCVCAHSHTLSTQTHTEARAIDDLKSKLEVLSSEMAAAAVKDRENPSGSLTANRFHHTCVSCSRSHSKHAKQFELSGKRKCLNPASNCV